LKAWNFSKTNQALIEIRQQHSVINGSERESMFQATINELYGLLEKCPYTEIREFGAKLTDKQLDLFERFLSYAPNSCVLAKTAVLFFYFRKNRISLALGHFAYFIPLELDTRQLRAWLQQNCKELSFLHGWVADFFRDEDIPDSLATISQLIEKRSLNWKDFEDQSPGKNTRLFNSICDAIFENGDQSVIPQLRSEMAHDLARRFLVSKDITKVSHFLSYYPNERWEQEFLEATVNHFGPPDPVANEFYRSLPEGVLWSFRTRVFLKDLHGYELEGMRKTFWKNWVHHCTDVRAVDGIISLNFGKMMIVEEKHFSLIKYGDHEEEIHINFGPEWETKLNQVINEYLY